MEQSYMGEKLEKSRFRSKIKVVLFNLLYMHHSVCQCKQMQCVGQEDCRNPNKFRI